jgi:hypothetical protein
MIDLQLGQFVDAFSRVCAFSQTMANLPAGSGLLMENRGFVELVEGVDVLWVFGQEADFGVIAVRAREASDELSGFQARPDDYKIEISSECIVRLRAALSRLVDAVTGESKTRWALVFSLAEKDLWLSKSLPFGEAVERVFPTTEEDIEEAAKCLAVDRGTACVFHLMRAMEISVQRMSAHLTILNVEREWGKLLSDIGSKIEAMPKGDARNEWSQVHVNLYHVKQAWRNDVMHPKKTYTVAEAKNVFDAVGAFMTHLAGLVSASAD